jgi:diaminopimelate epimerase
MNIPFTKMHGLGNDFVIVEEDQLPAMTEYSLLAKTLCDRHFGIGADGLIIVSPPDDLTCDIQFKFFNADGSMAEMCGNGIRCFARYVKDQGIVKSNEFRVETKAGALVPTLNADGSVTVDMGPPVLIPADVPFKGTTSNEPAINVPLNVTIGNETLTIPISAISMGNPHCVIFMDKTPKQLPPFEILGPVMERHPDFPARTNVEFCTILNDHTVEVMVWERSAGPTLACGTGACAVTVAGIMQHRLKSPVTVNLPGGSLTIQWGGSNPNVLMTGPATYVFAGMFPFVESLVSSGSHH